VTASEAQKFKDRAAEAGCKSISEYIRLRYISEEISVSVDINGVDSAEVETKIAKMK
jgi:hypothetical protein